MALGILLAIPLAAFEQWPNDCAMGISGIIHNAVNDIFLYIFFEGHSVDPKDSWPSHSLFQ